MKVLAIVLDTIRESLSKFAFTMFFGASTLLLAAFLFAFSQGPVQGGIATVKMFGATQAMDQADAIDYIGQIYRGIMVVLYSLGLFIALFATADLVPNMLKRGTIDLLLSKPLSRGKIYLSKYLGAMTVVGINIAYLVGGVWLILSTKTGQWPPGFLIGGLLTLLMFGVILTFTTFIGLISRSAPLALILAYTIIFSSEALYGLHKYDQWARLIDNPVTRNAMRFIIEALYYLLPKFHEVGGIIFGISQGDGLNNVTPIVLSLPFAAIFVAAGIAVFRAKDF